MGAPLRLGLAYLLIGLAPLAFGVRGVRESHLIAPTSLSHADGASYIASIPPSPFSPLLVAASDDLRHVQRSSARLFEDARELRPAHAVHAGIAAVGKGRFSHWTTAVYLSASDNSDPRTNGRVYRLETVARLPVLAIVAWVLTFLLAAVASARFRDPGTMAHRRLRMRLTPAVLAVASVVAVGMSIAGSGAAQVWALAIWFAVGLLAAFLAGVMTRGVSTGGFVRAVAEESPALIASLKSLGRGLRSLDQQIFDAPGWRGLAARMGCLTVPPGIFAATLTIAWPEWVLAQAYGGGGRVLLVAVPALWLTHARRGWLAVLFGLAVTLVLFALPLAALWHDVTIHLNAIGGLLPFSDAQGYYFEASRLLDGQPLDWSARRPLFPAFLAVLLAVTGSLHVVLAVMVALNATATFLLAHEVSRSFGSAAATVATLILFAFYRWDGGTGVVLSENLGFLLGTAAFTALLRGMRLQDIRSYASGAVLLTAALMARAGAFFVLPALIAAALLSLRQLHRRRRYNGSSALAVICAIAIAATTLLVWGKALSDPAAGNAAFSNYSQTLYGLVVGGKGWGQVYVDHPNAREGADVYNLAYEAFRARPRLLIEGMTNTVRAYLWPREYHMFAFIKDGPRTTVLQLLCYAVSLVGLGACLWGWRDPIHALVLAVVVGHFASIPFVPPIDAGLRVYAATTPVLALLAAAGIAASVRLFTELHRYHANQTVDTPPFAISVTSRFSETAALILLAVIMGSSWALYMAGEPRTVTRPTCPSGSESLVVRVDNDAVVRVEDDQSPRAISPTVVRQSEAQLSMSRLELRGEARNLRAGMSLTFAYDQLDGRQVWLAGDTSRLARTGLLAICGHNASDELARRYGMIYVDDARIAGTSSR